MKRRITVFVLGGLVALASLGWFLAARHRLSPPEGHAAESVCRRTAVAEGGTAPGHNGLSPSAGEDVAAGADRREQSPVWKTVLIDRVPHVVQKPDFCGEACAAMWLQYLGTEADQDWVFDCSGLDPLLARGCYTKELAAALVKIGFDVGPVWREFSAAEAAEELPRLWNQLHADLTLGVPSIVCMHYAEPPADSEHFRLVLGYDAADDQVIYHEPAETNGAYRRMSRERFLSLWPLKYKPDRWTVIRLRLKPTELKRPEPGGGFSPADFCQHMIRLRKKIPNEGFTVVIEPPFVVIGDQQPEVVRRWAAGTIRWAVRKLKEAYFRNDPPHIVDIWLFRNKESYNKHTREIFGSEPTTPFGYYSSADRALVMNIATGGGTLVHELVHPFVEGNFPECPAWFNEGLGSLYEQCHDVGGRIEGMTNWRLAGLQKAIRAGRLPSFRELCSTSSAEFYADPLGTNYAQARYLCYYLEQHHLLREFYRRFRENVRVDPTGYQTLQEVLGTDDMAAFQREWEKYVLSLSFP